MEVKDYPPYLDYPKEKKVATNYDLIVSKSVEELAKWLDGEYGTCEWCDIG